MKVELKRYCDNVMPWSVPRNAMIASFSPVLFVPYSSGLDSVFIFEFQTINRFQICKQLSTTGII